MNKIEKTLFLFDSNSHIHRSYYAAEAKNEGSKAGSFFNGKPNYIIEGAINLMEKEMRLAGVTPDYISIVLDPEGKNFRHDLYSKYKGNREPTPDNLKFMRNCIFKIMALKGYHTIREDGVEADDIIGVFAKKASRAGINVVIFTKDKDLLQLIDDRVSVFLGTDNKMYKRDDVFSKLGVYPEQILDYLTLLGDKADNIDGVPRCGPVSAVKMLQRYNLQQMIDNPSLVTEISGLRNGAVIADYISNNVEKINLMKTLVTLKVDINIGITLKELIKKEECFISLENAYEVLGLPKYGVKRVGKNRNLNSYHL